VLVGVVAFAGMLGVARAEDDEAADPIWQLNGTLVGQKYAYDYPTSVSNDGLQLNLEVELVKYDAPLRDDGAPYSLQPFLQYRSSWSVSVDGGHFDTRNPLGGEDRTDWSGGFSASVNRYVKGGLALTGGVNYGFDVLHDVGVDETGHAFSGSAGIGLRIADTRFDVSYTLESLYLAGSFAPLRQEFGARVYTVLERRLSVNLSGDIIPGGFDGDLRLEFYPTREVGIFGGGAFAKGELYAASQVITRYMGRAGASVWLDRTMALVGEYEYTVEDLPLQAYLGAYDGFHEVAHTLLFELSMRFDEL
jgi:hypothetical protein